MPTPPFDAMLMTKSGKLLQFNDGNGQSGFKEVDRAPDDQPRPPNTIVHVNKSSNPGFVFVKSPDNTTTLSGQPNGKREIRNGLVDGPWEQALYEGNRYIQYQAEWFTLYNPQSNLPF